MKAKLCPMCHLPVECEEEKPHIIVDKKYHVICVRCQWPVVNNPKFVMNGICRLCRLGARPKNKNQRLRAVV